MSGFVNLGLQAPLCQSIETVGWIDPTRIQSEVIPSALLKRDIVGLAETGSGKTGAFAIPIISFLLENPSRFYAVVVAPTRELAIQICEVFEALGTSLGLVTACLVGGISMVDQAIQLAKGPHVLIGTPGRIVDHLQNTKGFSLRNTRVVVFDEADRLLSLDFEKEVNYILSVTSNRTQTFLFSATMTKKVHQLQRSFLQNPVEISVNEHFQTPKGLVQQYVFIPAKWKDCYLSYMTQSMAGQSIIIFTSTCLSTLRLTYLLESLGQVAVSLHGQMTQVRRINAINRFRAGTAKILVATDVASRGLDIPDVDVVLNYDLPLNGKIYVHRVGRTARNGKAGRSVSFVTQYDIEAFQSLETLLGTKLPEFPVEENAALLLLEAVENAQRYAAQKCKEFSEGSQKDRRKHKRSEASDDQISKRQRKK